VRIDWQPLMRCPARAGEGRGEDGDRDVGDRLPWLNLLERAGDSGSHTQWFPCSEGLVAARGDLTDGVDTIGTDRENDRLAVHAHYR
jgi:hypothetical protein